MKKQKTKKGKRDPFPFKYPGFISICKEIFKDYRGPITLRQLFYRLVSIGLHNTKNQYGNLIKHMTKSRKLGWIGWDKIIDLDRHLEKPSSWLDPSDFLDTVTHAYKRDLQQGQEFHVEVWSEKTVDIKRITDKYDIGLLAGGGYESGPALYEASERFNDIGKPMKILYLGDLDPSGLCIQRDIEKRLRDVFHVDFELIRVLLLQEDILKYNPLPNAAKPADPRYKEFIKQYGPNTYEMDTLSPSVMQEKLESAIRKNIDIDLYEEQMELWEEGKEEIADFIETWNMR